MRPTLVICSAASLVLIAVVMAESFTNAAACERSVSESSPAQVTPDPSNVPKTRQVVTNVVFMSFPWFGNSLIILSAAENLGSLAYPARGCWTSGGVCGSVRTGDSLHAPLPLRDVLTG